MKVILGTMRMVFVDVLKEKLYSIIALIQAVEEMVSSLCTYFVAYGNAVHRTHSVGATAKTVMRAQRLHCVGSYSCENSD